VRPAGTNTSAGPAVMSGPARTGELLTCRSGDELRAHDPATELMAAGGRRGVDHGQGVVADALELVGADADAGTVNSSAVAGGRLTL